MRVMVTPLVERMRSSASVLPFSSGLVISIRREIIFLITASSDSASTSRPSSATSASASLGAAIEQNPVAAAERRRSIGQFRSFARTANPRHDEIAQGQTAYSGDAFTLDGRIADFDGNPPGRQVFQHVRTQTCRLFLLPHVDTQQIAQRQSGSGWLRSTPSG